MNIVIRNQEDKTYVVLGAPHSATSLISKALEEQGISMGNDMVNCYQDSSFVRANRKILKKAGGKWYRPPSEEAILNVKADRYLRSKINAAKRRFWGFKDPRTSLTIKKYLPLLDGDVYLICCFRKPSKVVESYKDRKKENVTKKTVDRFNRSIISAIKEFCEL